MEFILWCALYGAGAGLGFILFQFIVKSKYVDLGNPDLSPAHFFLAIASALLWKIFIPFWLIVWGGHWIMDNYGKAKK